MSSGATDPDFLPELPPDTLHIIISRVHHPNNTYQTKVTYSRRTRKYYAIGLLQEAIHDLCKQKSEIVGKPSMLDDYSPTKENKNNGTTN